ncbi:hypothetical protein G6F64_014824 [Rhizopus arrhizus]|uniref:Uncharacterized protein n=1 Tax=Rhizopus oryzae TaxID=64495 RepID=A0A9P7BIK1_RHIOR|nr:hypothetical protein G6F64_014824 [Rhizopus arrhizus]
MVWPSPFKARRQRQISCRISGASPSVASSRISTGAFFRKARAIEMRWRWPPDNCMPRSPTRVARPSGRVRTKSVSAAWSSARANSSGVASGRASRILPSSVSLNR